MTAQINSANSHLWPKAIRRFGVWLFAAAFLLTIVDFARSWNARQVLANAAEKAAKVTVSTPLNVDHCRDRTPCPVEWAAAAAKQHLLQAGISQAACINPNQPSFSGVLIWVFSCDGSSACKTSEDTVCIQVDMTPVARAQNGEFIPFTRVTVQCPHSWAVAFVLKLLPGKRMATFPKSVSASALARNNSVS